MFDDLKEIESLYEQGEIPSPEDLRGEYFVVVPWFPWFSLELLKHRKDVAPDGTGDNVIEGGLRFGHFVLEKDSDSLLINYDVDENVEVMKRVVDRIRRLPDGRLVGRLFYRILGQEVPLLYFEMRPK